MPKPKQPKNNQPTLEEFLRSYDKVSLYKAAESVDLSLGWQLMLAYVDVVKRQREVEALDLIGKGSNNQPAAYASGYAKGLEEIPAFLEGLKKTVLDASLVIENPRPEE